MASVKRYSKVDDQHRKMDSALLILMTIPSPTPPVTGTGCGELFQLFRGQEPRTRVEIAAMTGLSRSTVAARIDSLVSLGLVVPVGGAYSTGGRPPSRFALTPTSRLVAAVDLGARHVTVGIADLTGGILAKSAADIHIAEAPEELLASVVDMLETLLADHSRRTSEVLGIGIGFPGPVEHSTGRPSQPPIMPGWDGFDIPAWMQQRTGVPAFVDNDVNVMALGERSVAWPHIDDLMFVKVSTGIGAGIVSGGLLQRGAQGTAGDIGHVQIEREQPVSCHCGNDGCLEAVAAGPAIIGAMRSFGVSVSTTAELTALVREGNLAAIRAVRDAGRKIGEVLAICVSLINPSVIVLGGSLANAGEHLIAGVREVVYSRSTPLASRQLAIVPSRVGSEAGLLGAAELVLEHALAPASIDEMVALNS